MTWNTTNDMSGTRNYFAPSALNKNLLTRSRGDALRFASRLPLAIILRAVGAVTTLDEIIRSIVLHHWLCDDANEVFGEASCCTIGSVMMRMKYSEKHRAVPLAL